VLLDQHPKNSREMMTTVDHLKRLCVDHYFQDEIDIIVESCVDLIHSDDLFDATLSLRLIREAGYQISAG
jgi:(3S)-linalool synthase